MNTEEGERLVGKTYSSDTYHFLTADRTRSPCGALNNDAFGAADIAVALSQADAEQQGYTLCRQCADRAER